ERDRVAASGAGAGGPRVCYLGGRGFRGAAGGFGLAVGAPGGGGALLLLQRLADGRQHRVVLGGDWRSGGRCGRRRIGRLGGHFGGLGHHRAWDGTRRLGGGSRGTRGSLAAQLGATAQAILVMNLVFLAAVGANAHVISTRSNCWPRNT